VGNKTYFSPFPATDSGDVSVPAPHIALFPQSALEPHSPLVPHSALDAELVLDPHIADDPHNALEPHIAELAPVNTDGPHTLALLQYVVDPHRSVVSLTR